MKIDKINHKEIEPKELTEIIATTNMAESIAKVQSIIQKSVLRDKNDQPVFATDSANFIKSIIIPLAAAIITRQTVGIGVKKAKAKMMMAIIQATRDFKVFFPRVITVFESKAQTTARTPIMA